MKDIQEKRKYILVLDNFLLCLCAYMLLVDQFPIQEFYGYMKLDLDLDL